LKSENDELRDQLREVHNGTERREVEERCHGLINDLDELTKEKVSISKEKLKVEEKHREEQARNKELEDQLKELSQKVFLRSIYDFNNFLVQPYGTAVSRIF